MKLFNAATVIAIAAALPSTTSATLRRAPTNNYEERKLQDEVGSMPIDAIEPVDDHGGFIFDKIIDLKCDLAADLFEDRLSFACNNALDLLDFCPEGRRLDDHGAHWGSEDLCDDLCDELDDFFDNACGDRRKLKDSSSVMQKIDEERKLQDMEVMALGSVAMEEAVKSLDALDILGDKIFDFKCEVAADLVEERLDIACDNVADIGSKLGCAARRRLNGDDDPVEGPCDDLCGFVNDFIFNYCAFRT